MRILLTIFIMLLISCAIAAPAKASDPTGPLFQDDKTLSVTITAPLARLIKERPTEDYLPGAFKFKETDGTTVELDVEIRTRGHFRHKTCHFPPLGLNFKKSELEGTLFEQQNKLKLVVHCKDSARYEQTVLREYLAYRLFNQMTDQSFRVRLLRVTYVDSDGRRDRQVRYAFLIEHKNQLAKRLGRKDLKVEKSSISAIQPDQLNLTSIFEFLLGNTDFSPIAGARGECCHNYVLFGNDADPILAIPYDFDQSGFVNAPYAVPNERLNLKSVRQRKYRGRCANNGHIEKSLGEFRDNRDALFALIAGQEGMDKSVRKSIARYVDEFYEIIDDPRDVERKIVRGCL